ncbi:hypothetical protein BHM03_00051865 [Ensete ventricosum]|nr:hypothetical protein BHM03_00051865 [Ensete ventricosum]
MDVLRFQFLDLLRGVAVVSLLLARVFLLQIVSRSAFQVITPRSAPVLIFLAPTIKIQLPSTASNHRGQVRISVRVQIRLLRKVTPTRIPKPLQERVGKGKQKWWVTRARESPGELNMDLWTEDERRRGWETAPAGKAAGLPKGMLPTRRAPPPEPPSYKLPKLIKDPLVVLVNVASFSFEEAFFSSK